MKSQKLLFICGIFIMIVFLLSFGSVAHVQGANHQPSDTPTISPSSTPSPTIIPTATFSIEERIVLLEEANKKPKKDFWDKLDSTSGLITGGLVTAAIAIATLVYNARQHNADILFKEQELALTELQKEQELNLSELQKNQELNLTKIQKEQELTISKVQTVQGFLPSLKSNDPREVETALLSITALEFPELASKLAELFQTDGALSALNKMVASADPAISNAAKNSLDALFKASMDSIVQIVCAGSVGGIGFFIHTDGYILTTNHAIDAGGDILAITKDGELTATIVAQIPADNLALLKVEGSEFSTLSLKDEIPVEINSGVLLIGHDSNIGLVVSGGKITGLSRPDSYTRSDLINIEVMIPRSYGGAPVISQNGKIIGMVVLMWAQGEQVNKVFVLPNASLSEFVSDNINI